MLRLAEIAVHVFENSTSCYYKIMLILTCLNQHVTNLIFQHRIMRRLYKLTRFPRSIFSSKRIEYLAQRLENIMNDFVVIVVCNTLCTPY